MPVTDPARRTATSPSTPRDVAVVAIGRLVHHAGVLILTGDAYRTAYRERLPWARVTF